MPVPDAAVAGKNCEDLNLPDIPEHIMHFKIPKLYNVDKCSCLL